MTDYRLTGPAAREQFYQLYLYAFNRQDSARRRDYFFQRYDHGWIYGLHAGDQLVSGLYSLPFTVNFHGVNFRMNGIGDVMSAPEFSGRGGAGTLLRASLAEMAEKHVTLAYLAPFSYEYYRRFGYEQVFNKMMYTIAGKDVPAFRAQGDGTVTRQSLRLALPVLKPLYAQLAEHLRGGMVREDWWWEHLALASDWDAALYQDDAGLVRGYLLYERSGSTLTVQEWYAADQTAWTHLMAFLLKHGNTFATLEFADQDSRYRGDWFPNPYVLKAAAEPFMMARIVDLQDFFNRYPYTGQLADPVTLAVTDDTLPANQGVWRLSVAGAEKIGDDPAAEADISLSIQVLTKALFGTQPLAALVKSGRADGDQDAVARLDRVLHHELPMLNDYF